MARTTSKAVAVTGEASTSMEVADSTDLGQLESLAKRINSEYREAIKDRDRVYQSAKSATVHALEVGRLLLEAKEKLGHGHFMTWVAENTDVPHRTATNWLRIAKSDIPPELGVNQALRMLSEPKATRKEQVRYEVIEQDRYDEMPTTNDEAPEPPQQTLGEIADSGTDAIIRPQPPEDHPAVQVQVQEQEGKSVNISLPLDPHKAALVLRRYFDIDELVQELEELVASS